MQKNVEEMTNFVLQLDEEVWTGGGEDLHSEFYHITIAKMMTHLPYYHLKLRSLTTH